MDITKSVSNLLYYHDCVIMPGFGGFVCSYREAQIHPVLHTLSPPSKAVSFNINLRSNDGLLANQLIKEYGIPYQEALAAIQSWVSSATSLLDREKELNLTNIGRLKQDVEGRVQFEPDESVNYLPSSFGLPVITAAPVMRQRETASKEYVLQAEHSGTGGWRLAASIVLVGLIGVLLAAMIAGMVIEPLKLNEANVMSALWRFTGKTEAEIHLIPPKVNKAVSATNNVAAKADETIHILPSVPNAQQEVSAQGLKYYIIVGAFASQANLKRARNRILASSPASSLYEDSHHGITRIGYLAGSDEAIAKAELASARTADSSYWLLRK